MNRRAYLTGVGTVAVAGCLGFGESDDEASADSADNDSEADPERQSATVDENETGDSQPDEPEASESDDPDESDDSNESETDSEVDDRQQSEAEIEFERSIERAGDQYRAALAEYGTSDGGNDPTFLAVLPSTEVDSHDARRYLNAAADILWSESREYARTEEQETRVWEYRTYEEVIPKLARIQRSIYGAYTKIKSPDSEPMYTSGPSELDSAKRGHEELRTEFEDMELYMEEIQAKHDQQNWQIQLVERTFTGLVTIGSTRDIDDRSQTELQLARNEFETVIEELEDPTSAPPEDTTDQAFLDLVTEWYELTDETLREKST